MASVLAFSGLLLYLIPLWLLVKGFWAGLGFSIFILTPLRQRFPWLEQKLDEHMQVFRDVPTNAQISYADLVRDPILCDRMLAVRVIAKPAVNGEPSPPLGKRQRLAALVKQGLDFAERSSEYVSGQRYGGEGDGESFFASYKGMPGHLVIPPRSDTPGVLRFRTGIAMPSLGKPRTERLVWPMADIRVIRKVGGLNLAGLGLSHLGIGLDDMAVGLELVDSEGVVHRFDRCFRRDVAFVRCLLACEGVWQCS